MPVPGMMALSSLSKPGRFSVAISGPANLSTCPWCPHAADLDLALAGLNFLLPSPAPHPRAICTAHAQPSCSSRHIEVMDDRFEHAVGSVGIDEAHRRGLPHQGANVLLFRPPARPGGPLEMMVQMRSSKMLICTATSNMISKPIHGSQPLEPAPHTLVLHSRIAAHAHCQV